MVVIKGLVFLALAVVLGGLALGRLGWLQGRVPAGLGIHNGRLQPPARTPNSVSSQAALYPEHPMRAQAEIAPLPVRGSGASTIAAIRAIVEATPGAKIVTSERDYLYVRYTTRWMRFVDDTEFWFDPAADVIQVRSASRVGRSDFGANRQRIEQVRQRIASR